MIKTWLHGESITNLCCSKTEVDFVLNDYFDR